MSALTLSLTLSLPLTCYSSTLTLTCGEGVSLLVPSYRNVMTRGPCGHPTPRPANTPCGPCNLLPSPPLNSIHHSRILIQHSRTSVQACQSDARLPMLHCPYTPSHLLQRAIIRCWCRHVGRSRVGPPVGSPVTPRPATTPTSPANFLLPF
jgi:hypothetical protein